MAGEEFSRQVEELCATKMEAPKRLRELAARDWREIDDGTLRWVAERARERRRAGAGEV